MKKVTLFAALLLTSAGAFAQNWTLDKAHSKVAFTITHLMISEVDGNFKNFDIDMKAAKPDFSDANINFTADIKSVSTADEKRDAHLQTADFFDSAKYPTLSFKSKSLKKVSGNKYKLMGDLTMHGITKPVTLDAMINGPITHPMNKKTVAGFKVSGLVKRADFALSNYPSAVLSEDVEIRASGEFAKN